MSRRKISRTRSTNSGSPHVVAANGPDSRAWKRQYDLAKMAAALAVPTIRWLKTTEAAEQLGVSRDVFDAAAARAAELRPDLVVQAGTGEARRTRRWRSDGLSEALAAGQSVPVVEKPKRKKRKSRKPKGPQGADGPPTSRHTP